MQKAKNDQCDVLGLLNMPVYQTPLHLKRRFLIEDFVRSNAESIDIPAKVRKGITSPPPPPPSFIRIPTLYSICPPFFSIFVSLFVFFILPPFMIFYGVVDPILRQSIHQPYPTHQSPLNHDLEYSYFQQPITAI